MAGIDVNVLLNTILGGIITISGSLAVAGLYIRNQNKNQRKRRLQELIQQTYFEQGILPVLAALSEYGTNTVFALADTRIWLVRCFRLGEGTEVLKTRLEEIAKRPVIVDLTSHNFTNVLKWLPTLQKFGMPLYSSIKRTLQFYSSLVSDATSFSLLEKTIKNSSVEEVARSMGAVAQIIDFTLMYLEKRFTNLRDYFWQQELENYHDFSQVFSDTKYRNFLSVMDQYMKRLTQLMNAMQSEKPEDRPRETLSFSKWLGDNLDNNPLENNAKTEEVQKIETKKPS
ncbi:MAG: hypothetical protein ABSD73_00495 [Candidatus Bathyarchaeia archaeon]|jgi:hypothetical protein